MIKINLNNLAKVLKFIATVITSVLGTIAFLSCQDLLWRETAEGGHKMPGQGNQGLCRIRLQRQESRITASFTFFPAFRLPFGEFFVPLQPIIINKVYNKSK